MRKSLILAGMLSIGYAYAQEGKVGINTDAPKATIDIQPNANNAKAEATTNEGIIAPKLSKVRIANIENPVEGTLVYATDNTYTGSNTKVAKITEKGYYFYNGTEWVKAGANGELWAQRDNNGVTETYLKPADSNSDEYFYAKNRSYMRLGNVEENITGADGFVFTNIRNNTPHSLLLNGSVLPLKENAVGPYGKYYPIFSREYYKLDNTFTPTTTEAPKLRGKDLWLQVKDYTKNLGYAIGQNIFTDIQSSIRVGDVTGARLYSTIGDKQGNTSPTASRILGIQTFPAIYSGKATKIVGTYNQPTVYGGQVEYINGEETELETTSLHPNQTQYITHSTLKDVTGNRLNVINRPNSTTERLFGVLAYTTFDESSSVTSEAGGFAHSAYIKANSNIKNFAGISTYLNVDGASTMNNYYAFRFINTLNTAFQPTNMYGLYLEDVKQGATLNYAVYTNAGKVRVGDLKGTGDRAVYVDANGVLKTGGTIASNNGVQNQSGMKCDATNAGKINYTTKTINGEEKGIFGFCMQKGTEYVWGYMLGGGNLYGTSADGAAFGDGL